MRIAQKLESLNSYKLRGQQVTLSFWVRFSNATVSSISNAGGGGDSAYGNFGYSIGSYTSTTDSATNTSAADAATNATITNGSLPTTWTKYTLTGTISSTANNVDVVFGFASLGSTTSADTEWFEIAQVQLETGSQATPFEQRPYGVELALCQRYYWRTYGSGTLSDLFGSGIPNNTTTAYIGVPHPVEMRIAATSLDFNAQVTDLNNDWNTTGSSIYSGNKRSTTVRVTEGAYFTAFRPIFVNLNTTSRYIGLSAEL
jgi:hypothetical protein